MRTKGGIGLKRPFLWMFLFLAGNLLLLELKMGGVLLGIGSFLTLLQGVLLFLRIKRKISKDMWKKDALIVGIMMLILLLGGVRLATYKKQIATISDMAESGVQLRGTGKIKKISETEYGYAVELTKCKMAANQTVNRCNDVILYFSKSRSGQENLMTQYHTGDRVYVTGVPQVFMGARNEGGYDESRYAYGMGRIAKFQDPEIKKIGQGSGMDALFDAIRQKAKSVFQTYLSTDNAGIGMALVTGEKGLLSGEDEELFYEVGVGHILAISGLHLSIMGMGLYAALERVTLPLTIRCIFAGMFCLLFTLFSGAGVSSVRACIMMIVLLGAYITGRRYDFFSAIGFAGTLLLVIKPWSLCSVSFQYSFLAVVGVGVTQILLKATFLKLHPLLRAFFISMGSWIFTLPVAVMTNYRVSLVGILLNIVVIPLMSPLLALLISGLLLGMSLGGIRTGNKMIKVIFWFTQQGMEVLRKICHLGANMPYNNIITGRASLLKSILFIGSFILLIFYVKKTKKRMYLGVLPILVVWMCINPYSYKGEELVFLDVGQGDGIYLQDGKGKLFFMDGGSSNIEQVGKERILPFFYSRRITKIDGWFVSHCDKDHVSGLLDVLRAGFPVGRIFLYKDGVENEYFAELIRLAQENKTEICYLQGGATIRTSAVEFKMLNVDVKEDINCRSLVLQLCFLKSGKKALFAGDIDIETEDKLAEIWNLEEIFIWKATHHGSKYSNGENILAEMRPSVCLVSCSKHNLYGHPAPEAIARMEEVGATILYTMEEGQIKIRFSEGEEKSEMYIIPGTSCTFP